jgi:NADH:ubiquinone oxidoreductase subunit E
MLCGSMHASVTAVWPQHTCRAVCPLLSQYLYGCVFACKSVSAELVVHSCLRAWGMPRQAVVGPVHARQTPPLTPLHLTKSQYHMCCDVMCYVVMGWSHRWAQEDRTSQQTPPGAHTVHLCLHRVCAVQVGQAEWM